MNTLPQQETKVPDKATYQAPEIIEYGSIETTTQLGTTDTDNPFAVSTTLN